MRKIGILTFANSNNYGSKLQAYSIYAYLLQKGYEPNIIIPKNICFIDYLNSFCEKYVTLFFRKMINKELRKTYKKLQHQDSNPFCVENIKWDGFDNAFLYVSKSKLKELNNIYQAFICGSDQVWSPLHIPIKKYYYLTFAKHYKKIAYAPSFGVSRMPSFNKIIFQYIDDFEHISVREETGKRLIKDAIDRDSTVVVDPVFLFGKDFWLSKLNMSNCSSNTNGEAIFLYLLNQNEKLEKRVEELSKETGLKVMTIENDSPEVFVSKIYGSSIIITDSFHAVAFSIIFRKDFYCFKRNINEIIQQESRIVDFLSNIHLAHRYFKEETDFVFNNEKIDYALVQRYLDPLIGSSSAFLDSELERVNNE